MCVIMCGVSNKTEKTAITRRLGRASVTGPDADDYDTTAYATACTYLSDHIIIIII